MNLYSRIIGSGGYLPARVLTNQDVEEIIDTSDDWIQGRTGIRKRHILGAGESCSSLAEVASRQALEMAGIEPCQIDLILVATTTPDQVFPSTACLLQQRLDIHGCCAFDLQAVCAGFVYALDVADRFIRTGGAKRALVVGAETMSRLIDWKDRTTAVLFGDGAGALVLEAASAPGILSSHLHADGSYASLLQVRGGIGGGSDATSHADWYMEMKGNEVFKMSVTTLCRIAEETLKANGMEKSDIDWLVPHQANIRIIQATARKLELPMDRVVVTVGEHANTSAASIPLAFDAAVRDGRIRRGETVLMEGFGAGFTWGSVLLRY